VNNLVSSVAAPVVNDTASRALDTSAKSDATQLGEELALFYVDKSGPPPPITMEGENYVIAIPGETPITIGASSGVTLGGVAGTGTTSWCVWVTAEQGELKDFQYSAEAGLIAGRC